jgi:TolB-like protein/Tfp pilus assembly protein PilF
MEPEAYRLWLGTREIMLRPKTFETLRYLVKHHEHTVTKEELFETVWPDTHVTESVLTHSILEAREALGDDAKSPRYIRTVPRRGYRFIADVQAMWSDSEEEIDQVKLALAVLPLENLMHDPHQNYFVQGMHDALITELSKIRALRIISRSSTAKFENRGTAIADVARELNVEAVVEGSVLRSDKMVRITVQLIALDPERHLWAESYQRELRDVLELQSEVAQAIAREIKITVTAEERQRLTTLNRVQPASHEAFLKGMFWFFKQTLNGYQKAIKHFQTAIEADSSNARAHSGMALALCMQAWNFHVPPRKAFAAAERAVARSIELDNSNSEAYAYRGWIRLVYQWDLDGAEKDLRLAIRLNPSSSEARRMYSHCLSILRQPARAIAQVKRARELDPLVLMNQLVLGIRYWDIRQYAKAIEEMEAVLEMDENHLFANQFIAWSYEAEEMFDKAFDAWHRALLVLGDLSDEASSLWRKQFRAYGWRGALQWRLEQLQKKLSRAERVDPMEMARLHARFRDPDQTLRWLERSFDERHPILIFALGCGGSGEPYFDFLLDHPDFADLLRRTGLGGI